MPAEEVEVFGPREHPRSKSLFDNDGSASVLSFIESRVALALVLYQRAECRGPVKYGCVSEVEDVMEPVTIGIWNVVRKWVAEEYAVPTQVTVPAMTPDHFDFEVLRQLLVIRKTDVERRKGRGVASQKTATDLLDIDGADNGQVQTGSP